MLRPLFVPGALLAALVAGCFAPPRPSAYPFRIEPGGVVRSGAFLRSMNGLNGRNFLGGNAVTTLVNGDEIFPSMLEAIEGAQDSICFETYVYWSGDIADRFAGAIAERARAGVHTHVLIDGIGGAKMEDELVERMREAGADVRFYNPVEWTDPSSIAAANFRTHRKLLVVDGRIGFVGGVGIADEWTGDARDEGEWRDNHYRVEGPVVVQLQGAFADNWMDTTQEVLHHERYYPRLEDAGEVFAQVLTSSSEADGSTVQLMYLLAISAAQQEILITTPYFVPDEVTADALCYASRRGVRVAILVPGPKIDFSLVREASRARWGPLLEAGVEMYEFQPTMIHVKSLVVDSRWVSIGSANVDNRSFSLNDEVNLDVYDEDFAEVHRALFAADLARSQRITKVVWKKEGFWSRLRGRVASLFGGQL